MPSLLSLQSLKAFFDANPGRYTSAAHGVQPLSDGYLPSPWLDYQLCTPDSGTTKSNPVKTQPNIPSPFTAEQLLGAVAQASAAKIIASPSITKLIDAIVAQDRVACNAWAALHAAAGNLTSTDLTAVQAILNTTVPDPTWAANLPISDLEANFVDGLGNAPMRLQLAQNADGSAMCPGGAIAFLNAAAAVGAGVFAVTKTFEEAMHLATDEIRLFGLKLSASTEEMAAFSPALANAQAVASIRSLMDDIREANEVGSDLARMVDAQSDIQHEMREIWLPIKSALLKYIVPLLEEIVIIIRAIKNTASVMEPAVTFGATALGITPAEIKEMPGLLQQILAGVLGIQAVMPDEKKADDSLEKFLKEFYDQNTNWFAVPTEQRDQRPNIPIVNEAQGI